MTLTYDLEICQSEISIFFLVSILCFFPSSSLSFTLTFSLSLSSKRLMLWIADGPLIVGGSQIAEDLCRPHLPRAYQTEGDALDFVRSMWEMGGGGGGTKRAGQGVAPGKEINIFCLLFQV